MRQSTCTGTWGLGFLRPPIDAAYRIDLLINDELIIEVKCVQRHEPVFEAQLLTYLRLLDKKRGLLLNFGLPLLKHGIKRFSR